MKFTYLAPGFISALFAVVCPLGAISWPSSIKGQIHPCTCPKGPNEVSCQTPIMQLPGCWIWWPLVSCFAKSTLDKGPFDGLPFSNQSTPSPLGLQHLLLCNLISYSVQPDPIDKLNLSKPDILVPPRGKLLALILAFARRDMVSILTHFCVCLGHYLNSSGSWSWLGWGKRGETLFRSMHRKSKSE